MKGKVTWINVDGTTKVENVVGKPPSGESMKEFLGDWPEHVTVLHNGKRASMFVHEMGRVLGLPRNVKATEIYFALSRSQGRDPMAEFEAMGNTGPKKRENVDTPFGKATEYNMDPRPTEPPGIFGPAILMEGYDDE